MLNAGNGRVLDALISAMLMKSGVDLTSAENDTLDLVWLGDSVAMLRVRDDPLELRVTSEFLDTRASNGVTEQGLGEENKES